MSKYDEDALTAGDDEVDLFPAEEETISIAAFRKRKAAKAKAAQAAKTKAAKAAKAPKAKAAKVTKAPAKVVKAAAPKAAKAAKTTKEAKPKRSKAGHKAQANVPPECWSLIQDLARDKGVRDADVVRAAIFKGLKFKPSAEA